MKNIAVFVSGHGSNLQAIIDNISRGALKAHLALVISDTPEAFALKRAQKAGVRTLCLDPEGFATKQAYEQELVKHLKEEKIALVVLAGFMRILSPYFIKKYRNRILNIHPALLPAFKGAHAIRDAYRYGAKVTGVTVHIVDEKVDHGPIIAQESVVVRDAESVQALEKRIHQVEHKLYPQAIHRFLQGRLKLKGRRICLSAK